MSPLHISHLTQPELHKTIVLFEHTYHDSLGKHPKNLPIREMKRLAVVLALVPMLIIAACTPADEEAVDQEIDTLQTETTGEVQDWRTDVDSSLAQIDVDLDSLEAQAEEVGAEMETEFNNTLADLRERRDSLQQELQEIDISADPNVENLRFDIEMQIDELESDIQAARDRYAEDETGV